MRIKIGGLMVLMLMIVTLWGMAWAESSDIRIIQNGQEMQFLAGEGQVVIDENGRTLIPVRKAADILGAAVDWNAQTRTVTVKKGDIILLVTIGEQAIRSGNKIILMDTASKIIDGRTYLPVRAIAENLGYRVLWEPQSRTIAFEADPSQDETGLSQMDLPVTGDPVALMKTSMGDIRIKLLRDAAPKAVENFIGLAESAYYDNLIFHRVIPDFMIQGGDPNGNGTGGQSLWGKPFEDEFSETVHNFRGALSMANSGADTNGSQFFIVQLPATSIRSSLFSPGTSQEVVDAYTGLGGTPWLDGKHTVFGQVYEGMEVVDRIAGVKTGDGNKPVEAVTIISITIETIR